jgi:type I restriction enzyme R subunit
VLIVTDRDELEGQIEDDFKGVNENIYRTKSGKDLIDKLNDTKPWLICSLIHKFGKKDKPDYDNYIAELKSSIPKDFRAKGEIYVFVDECHRTQSGKLHAAMKELLPNALLIGFTGTPLLKKDKQNSIKVFGSYIPLLSLWANSTNLRCLSLRRIKVSPQFDRRGLHSHLQIQRSRKR